ncbi:MAG: hypothetical protein V1907_02745 [Candidatus Kerfeldbacteria bacterium]
MSLTRYLTIMGIGTAISSASWIIVLMFIDPETIGFVGVALFFVSFFLMIFGIASIVGFVVRRLFQRYEVAFKLVAISFRQAILIALMLSGTLFLQSRRLFTWWTSIPLLVFLSLVEAFFVARSSIGRHSEPKENHGT